MVLNYYKYFIFTILLCYSSLSNIQSQEPSYWPLTDEDGLPSMTVYEILQDDQGYMWMGTENGIYKYDGRSFKGFLNEDLKDNEILKIRKDKWDRIWFLNVSGQLAYIEKEKIILFNQDSILIDKEIINIQIGESIIWFSYKENNSRKKGVLSYNLYKNENPVFSKQYIHKKVNSFPFLTQHDTISIVDIKSNNSMVLRHYTIYNSFEKVMPYSFKNNHPTLFHYSSNNTFIGIGNRKSTTEIIAMTNDSITKVISFNALTTVTNFKVIDNICWITSIQGVWKFPLDGNQKQVTPKRVLKNVNANDITKDQEGNHWVSTTGQGIKIIPSLSMTSLNTEEGSLPNNESHRLYYNTFKDQIISGHNDGKVVIHKSFQETQTIDLKIEGRVLDIAQNQHHNFYFTTDIGVTILDSFLNFKSQNLMITGGKAILEDCQNNIWFSSGIFLGKTDSSLSVNPKKFKHYFPKRTYAILEDYSKRIWIGTTQGIYFFQDSIVPYLENNIHEKFYVTSMTQSTDSTIWISTKANGIIAIKKSKIKHRITEKNGLASNQCKRIYWDGALIWIATNKGLNYFRPGTENFGLVNKKDGLPSNEIHDVIIAKNEVWVATPKGIVHFPKSLIHYNKVSPPVYITSLKVGNKQHSIDTFIQLKHHQNNLQLDFIGLGFKAKNAITYKYKLDGIDQDWIYTENPVVRYPSINPGSYRFKVYAINEDGVESSQAASLSLNIAIAWWQSSWLKLTALIFLIGSVFLFSRNQFQKKEEKQKLEEAINQLKQEALQAQMNPHFIFNVLAAIQESLLSKKQEQAMLYLSNFSKLIRYIFDYSKKKEITLEEEINFLKHYLDLEKLRFKDKVKIKLTIAPELKEYLYFITIPPLLLQPLVENAFKHGLFHKEKDGHLLIHFSKIGNFLQFTVEDNGIGRKESKLINQSNWHYESHHSSGLQIIDKRLHILNQKEKKDRIPHLKIEDMYHKDKAIGTRITASIYCSNFN